MPIEKIIVRMLIVVAALAVILTLTFYPPSYAMMPLVFLFMCVMAEVALPQDFKKEPKGLPKTVSKVLIVLLGFAALACIVIVGLLWRTGSFWRLR